MNPDLEEDTLENHPIS